MGNKRKGFTMFEILTAIVVMILLTAIASINVTSSQQTPKREAERIAAYLSSLVQKADLTKTVLKVEISNSKISADFSDYSGNKIRSSDIWNMNLDCNYITYFDPANHSNTNVTTLKYDRREDDYRRGVKISAMPKLSGSYDNGITYNYSNNKKGHRYIKITSLNKADYYVVITGKDLAE